MPRPTNPDQGGFPAHGDPYPIEGEVLEEEAEEELEEGTEEGTRPEASPVDPADELAALKARLDASERELSSLRAQLNRQPPIEPKIPASPPAEPDWEKLWFSNPKEAARLLREQAKLEVTQELTGRYQQDRNQEKFWRRFYAKNKDLQADHDLVETTLNSNIATLAGMPVDDAMIRLADLTRERIVRYAGGAKQRRTRAFAEGATPPRSAPSEPEPPAVLRLGDIIRARAAKRRKAKGQAA